MFAKLFNLPDFGQVVAMLDADDDGCPVLTWYFQPPGQAPAVA